MTATVTLPLQVAEWLVSSALSQLWIQIQGGDTCCPVCCAPCAALKRLMDLGKLDDLARPVSHGDYLWDPVADGVSRVFLDEAWRGCLFDGDHAQILDGAS